MSRYRESADADPDKSFFFHSDADPSGSYPKVSNGRLICKNFKAF
jgi:hypothetical protein